MSGFGTVWRTKAHEFIRTLRSLRVNTGRGRAAWSRLQETEALGQSERRLKTRRELHAKRRSIFSRLPRRSQ